MDDDKGPSLEDIFEGFLPDPGSPPTRNDLRGLSRRIATMQTQMEAYDADLRAALDVQQRKADLLASAMASCVAPLLSILAMGLIYQDGHSLLVALGAGALTWIYIHYMVLAPFSRIISEREPPRWRGPR